MPVGSKMDLLLAKAKPISDGGSASVITFLRSGKIAACISWRRKVSIFERNNYADTKVSEEGEGGGAPGAGEKIPLQPVVKSAVMQVVPLQPMEVHGGADIHLQPVKDPTLEQMDMPKGDCDPVGTSSWTRSWQDLWSSGGPTLEQSVPEGLHPMEKDTWKGSMLEQFVKNCSLWDGRTLEKFVEDCLPWVGLHNAAGKRVRRKEQKRKCVMN
ncbi:hypothetical protein GRJ2_003214500 [Grus japonensis]|uniref:Uncharacterized protein n=1 Tax=Grus japonensis TaxID=30415 RepID=A0ABC9YBN2_GRUJA